MVHEGFQDRFFRPELSRLLYVNVLTALNLTACHVPQPRQQYCTALPVYGFPLLLSMLIALWTPPHDRLASHSGAPRPVDYPQPSRRRGR